MKFKLFKIEMAAKESKFCDETLQVLKKQLICQVCKSGPRPEKVSWYKCNAEHSLCQDCYKETCRTLIWVCMKDGKDHFEKCNAIVLKNPCKLTEALLSMKSMRFVCVSESQGCKEILDKEAMILHEPKCIQNYSLVACPRKHKPILKMPFHELLGHLTQCHPSTIHKLSFNEKLMQNIFLHDGLFYQTNWVNKANARLEIDGKTFIHSMREIAGPGVTYLPLPDTGMVMREAQIYQWIHFVGSPKEAMNYIYTLEYYGNDDSTSTYTGQVIPIDEDYESIVSNHDRGNGFNCPFVMNFGIFENKFVKYGHFKYSIKIRNLKEEVKDENANPESNK